MKISCVSLLLVVLFTARSFAVSLTERVRLTTEHVDLTVILAPEGTNLLQLIIRDEDRRTNHFATNAVLVVAEAAKLTIPDGFPELGPAGTDLWVLPASQNPQLLYLGVSGEDLPLPAQPLDLFVRRLDGSSHLAVWQFDGSGGMRLAVSSRDGLTRADKVTPQVGGHEHHNFGFTTNGYATVWIQARATVDGTNAWSPETPILFAVEPVPALTPFQEWQAEQWPETTDPGVIGPDVDPDGDGRSNLLEYAHGLNPHESDTIRPVAVAVHAREGTPTGSFTYRRAKRATDLQFSVEAASSLDGPWQPLSIPDEVNDEGDAEWITLRDFLPVAEASARFYRVRLALK